ncbi:MAG TPA: efflux RND transporter periplasmic adaptor subunit [Kofleriaceae bacterium]|nr:efflux RND transporter periplasmic adaptor subunit [Kofleriaceae bacterium]
MTPRRFRRWRWAAAAAVVAALAAAGVVVGRRYLGSERSIDGERLRTAEVTRGTLVRDAAVSGRVVAAVSPTLYAPVPGTVTVKIRAGDSVKKGEVLAVIDSPELQSELDRERSTLAQLEAQRGSARIATDKQRLEASREADEAVIALTAAKRDLQRTEEAWKVGAIPEVDLLKAKDALESATIRDRNARASAKLTGKSSGFDLKTAEKQHERQRIAVTELERRVSELSITAPVDGVVGTLSVADRAKVPADAPLMTLVDLSVLEVELEVPETYADDLGLGMTAEVKIGATSAIGTLSALSPEVVKNNVLVRVRFAGPQPAGLRQSQRVSARILIEERPDVVMVPRGPFLEAHGGRFIYVVQDGVGIRRAIRTGATSVSAVEVLEGLSPGERVIIAGSEDFEDAGSVQIN